jgi:hypothetical protein
MYFHSDMDDCRPENSGQTPRRICKAAHDARPRASPAFKKASLLVTSSFPTPLESAVTHRPTPQCVSSIPSSLSPLPLGGPSSPVSKAAASRPGSALRRQLPILPSSGILGALGLLHWMLMQAVLLRVRVLAVLTSEWPLFFASIPVSMSPCRPPRL